MGVTKFKVASQADEVPSVLVVIGLAVFTFVVVTARLGLAEAGIIVALVGLLKYPQRLRLPAPFWWALALIVWAFATAPWAMDPQVAQSTAIERLKVFVVFLVVINALRTESYLRLYILFVLACFMLSPVRGTLIGYAGGYTYFGRAIWNASYGNPNDLAAMSLLTLGLALCVLTDNRERKIWRWISAVCATCLVAVILLTQSRGAFIGMIVGLGPGAFGLAWKRPRLLVTLLIVGAVGTAFVPSAVWTRLSGIGKLTDTSTIAKADPEGSAAQRWEIQKTAFRIFQDHPIAGIGLGCYPLANNLYSPRLGLRDTHNTYLNLAAELGLPGLLLWLGLIISTFRRWRRGHEAAGRVPEHSERYATCAVWIQRVIIGFLISALFGSYSGITMVYLLLGILWSAGTLILNGSAVVATPFVKMQESN
jgi:O-antigen ligase